jgi:hypothetical protein
VPFLYLSKKVSEREKKRERERHTRRQTRAKVRDGKKVGINMTLVKIKEEQKNRSKEYSQLVVYYER